MNTRASVAYGWGILCLAGGGAYYFAKRSINSDRAERAMAEEQRRQQRERLRAADVAMREGPAKKRAPNAEKVNHSDPAPVEHAQAPHEDSPWEQKEVFRSKKGDRFSSWK